MNMKKIFTLALLAFSIIGFTQVPSHVPTNGLIAYWPFNGNANDLSGNAKNGTVTGAILTSDRFGSANSAYNFSGATQFITCTSISELNGSSSASFSLWVKINGNNKWNNCSLGCAQYLLSRDADYSSTNIGINYGPGNKLFGGRIGSNGSGIGAGSTNTYTIPQSTWHHIVFTIGGGFVKLYVDGVFNTSTAFNGVIPSSSGNLFFGKLPVGGYEYYLNGFLDDIGIWNRALTATEITNLYNNTAVSISNPPVAASTQTFCGSTTVADLAATGTNLKWYATSSGGSPLTSSTLLSNNTTYYVTQTISGFTESERVPVLITLTPIVTPTFIQVTPVCSGTTFAALPTTSTNGITGTWSPAINNIATTTYTFTPTAGLCANTVTMIIAVNPNVTPTFTQQAQSVYNYGFNSPIATMITTDGWSRTNQSTEPTTVNQPYAYNWIKANYAAVTVSSTTPANGFQDQEYTIGQTCPISNGQDGTANSFVYVTYLSTASTLTSGATISNWLVSPTINVKNGNIVTFYTRKGTNGTFDYADRLELRMSTAPATNPAGGPTDTGSFTTLCTTVNPDLLTGFVYPKVWTKYSYTVTGLIGSTDVKFAFRYFVTDAGAYGTNSDFIGIDTFSIDSAVCSGATITSLPTTSTNAITGTWTPAINNTATTTYTFTPAPGQCATTTTQTITITSPKVNSPISFVDAVTYLPNVTIGTQVWTNKNLDVTTYRDGTPIPQVTDPTAWAALTTGAWCYYNNDPANGAIYGKLYNWYAVAGIYDAASLTDPLLRKQLAPIGWHVPNNTEWTTLRNYLGGTIAGGAMKAIGTSLWASPNTDATNSSGFTGLPGGNQTLSMSFGTNIGTFGYWWTSSELSLGSTTASRHTLSSSSSNLSSSSVNKAYGQSVRCVRD